MTDKIAVVNHDVEDILDLDLDLAKKAVGKRMCVLSLEHLMENTDSMCGLLLSRSGCDVGFDYDKKLRTLHLRGIEKDNREVKSAFEMVYGLDLTVDKGNPTGNAFKRKMSKFAKIAKGMVASHIIQASSNVFADNLFANMFLSSGTADSILELDCNNRCESSSSCAGKLAELQRFFLKHLSSMMVLHVNRLNKTLDKIEAKEKTRQICRQLEISDFDKTWKKLGNVRLDDFMVEECGCNEDEVAWIFGHEADAYDISKKTLEDCGVLFI